jgi:tetratricopeptide (TPR) repeat protein
MKIITASLLALGLTLGTSAAFAAGSGSGGGATTTPTTGTTTSPMQLHCKVGEVAVTVRKPGKAPVKACKKVKGEILPDSELFQQGRLLAKQGQYDWAITVLETVKDQNDPSVLNYLGYSNRKAGRLDLAITYYAKALAIDPNYVLAREYLGEGYVAAGKLDLAKVQLNEIANRAGTSSEEYIDLAKAINGASI